MANTKGIRLPNGEFDAMKSGGNPNHDAEGKFSSGGGGGGDKESEQGGDYHAFETALNAAHTEKPEDKLSASEAHRKSAIYHQQQRDHPNQSEEGKRLHNIASTTHINAAKKWSATMSYPQPKDAIALAVQASQRAANSSGSAAYGGNQTKADDRAWQKSPVDEQDPVGYVGEAYRDAPKVKAFVNPQTGRLMMELGEDDLLDVDMLGRGVESGIYDDPADEWKMNPNHDTKADDRAVSMQPSPPYVDREEGDLLADRTNYHHSPERYDYSPAPDWNDDTTTLPDAWVRAHPFGNPYSKDAHSEYFDAKTNFHDDLLKEVPVSYYHNYSPDGEPSGDPMAIGKTIARKYGRDGRWDKIRFSDGMPKETKARIAEALARGTLRASPTVVPDFHEVDQNGHIKNWLTGSIAVLDAHGARQPASPKAIGIPAMKALFKAAQIEFPKELVMKKRFSFKAMLKAMLKALDEEEVKKPAGLVDHTEPDEDDAFKALFEDSNPEESARTEGALGNAYWTNQFNGITDSGRFDGADRARVQKDVSGLPQEGENMEAALANEDEAAASPMGDPNLRLDWQRNQKAMRSMKAQMGALQNKADASDFREWFSAQMTVGKVMPAEYDDIALGYRQALSDDRAMRPTMKSANGKPVSRVRVYQRAIEAREGKFGERQLTGSEMKAMGWQMGGFDQTPKEKEWSEARKNELLAVSPLGATILKEAKHA